MAKRKKKLDLQESVAPNLIPMVDIMFLLLLFFMLGADMGQRDLEEVRMPDAMSVKEDKAKDTEEDDRFTVNVYHHLPRDQKCADYDAERTCYAQEHWKIGIKAKDYTNRELLLEQLKKEAAIGRESQNSKISERPVMIRADRSAPYGEVQKVMNACAQAGIYRVEVGAARPADADKRGK